MSWSPTQVHRTMTLQALADILPKPVDKTHTHLSENVKLKFN